MKDYQRDEIVAKLYRNGFKPVYRKNSKQIAYFLKPRSGICGIKNLGYLDFLNCKAYKNKRK